MGTRGRALSLTGRLPGPPTGSRRACWPGVDTDPAQEAKTLDGVALRGGIDSGHRGLPGRPLLTATQVGASNPPTVTAVISALGSARRWPDRDGTGHEPDRLHLGDLRRGRGPRHLRYDREHGDSHLTAGYRRCIGGRGRHHGWRDGELAGRLHVHRPVTREPARTATGCWPATAAFSSSAAPASTAPPAESSSTGPSWGWRRQPTGRATGWLASDGGIFSFGDAGFHGSTGGINLNQPIVGDGSHARREGLLAAWPVTEGSSPSVTPASTDLQAGLP